MNAHRGILNRLQWMQRIFRIGAGDRQLQKTPFSFDVSVWEFFWPLLFGATLVVARPEGHRDPAYIADLIERQGITITHFVPSMLAAFVEDLGLGRCATLERVFCSGEALPPALVEAFFARLPGVELHNLYGPTEAAVEVTHWRCHPGAAVIPIGRPIDNTQIYLLDSRMEPVPIGARGELYIGGVQVCRGYLNRDELTAERFVADPFSTVPGARLYRTGDVARHLPSGDIEYLGRADFQVKIRGFRIELGEIEAVLGRHEGVREVTVVVREDTPGDKRIIAYLVPSSEPPSAIELRAFLADRLPEYMVPSVFVPLLALPLSASGKVDRNALPAPETTADARVFVAPRGPFRGDCRYLRRAAALARGLCARRLLRSGRPIAPGDAGRLARPCCLWRRYPGAPPLRRLDAGRARRPRRGSDRRRKETASLPLTRAPRTGPLPLSFAQERMWLLDQLDPGDPSYIIPRALRLRGQLDITALERAVGDIVARHEVLRTTFATVDGRAQPVFHARVDTALPVTRWPAVSAEERESLARREAEVEAHRPSASPKARSSAFACSRSTSRITSSR